MSPASTVPVAAFAMRARIVRKFSKAGAHGPSTARTLDELGLRRGLVVRRMILSGVLQETSNGKLWLDEAQYALSRSRSRKYVAIAIAAVVVVFAVLLLLR